MAGSILRKFGRGLALIGAELRVQLFGKQLKSSTTAPTNGQALVYVSADDAWSPQTVSGGGGSLPSGTAGLPLVCSTGTTYATTDLVNTLRVSYSGSTALDADNAIGIGHAKRIVGRSSADSAWRSLLLWDEASGVVVGTTHSNTNTVIQCGNSGTVFLRRNAVDYIQVAATLTIGITTAVTQYQGGARVPVRTVNGSGGAVAVDDSDEVIFVDTTSVAVTLNLQAGTDGRTLLVQRIAGTNSVTINRAGSDTILTAGTAGTSWVISDSARHSLIYRTSATQWVAEA